MLKTTMPYYYPVWKLMKVENIGKGRLLWVLVLVLCSSYVCGTGDREGGDGNVYKGIEAAVRELDPDNAEQLASLSQLIKDRAFKDLETVVRMIHHGRKTEAENAMAVVMEIGPPALLPLLGQLSEDNSADLVWDMQTVVSLQIENRSRIVEWLDKMLEDKTVLPPAMISLDEEEQPVERRLCDEAYLMMRRLFALEEEESELINTELFLDLTDEERDQEIERARQTDKWISLSEPPPEEARE